MTIFYRYTFHADIVRILCRGFYSQSQTRKYSRKYVNTHELVILCLSAWYDDRTAMSHVDCLNNDLMLQVLVSPCCRILITNSALHVYMVDLFIQLNL